MSFGDKYYVGHTKNEGPQVFASDSPEAATPEASGYESVDGPFDTKEEAESLIDDPD